MTPWSRFRLTVLSRDQGRCRMCGKPAHQVHHRMVKGSGGSTVREFSIANCVSLCHSCHARVHARPEESYSSGFLVHSGMDPAQVPLEIISPGFAPPVRVILKDDGTTEGEDIGLWF